MSIEVSGKIEWRNLGVGTWALVTESGETYELKDTPPALSQTLNKVKVIGKIRHDVMTIAMIGPVLEVESFEDIEG
jgi:hypothetical protein